MTAPPGVTVPPLVTLLADLVAERDQLMELVRSLPPHDWQVALSDGEPVVAHLSGLALLDEAATMAVTAPRRFATHRRPRHTVGPPTPSEAHCSRPVTEILGRLEGAQADLVDTYRALPAEHPVPWYGAHLDAAAAVAARLAETWAHGWSLARAWSRPWPVTERLRTIADLGVRSLRASFEMCGHPVPRVPVWIELFGPDGQRWCWGRQGARETVVGAAEDLCLVLSGLRGAADVPLRVTGVVAAEWLAVGRMYPGALDWSRRRFVAA